MTCNTLSKACAVLFLGTCLASSARAQQAPKLDLENIGRRNINPGFQPMTPALDYELSVGRQAAAEFEKGVKLYGDPAVASLLERIGQSLARNSDAVVPIVTKAIESDELNAFAFPGGHVYVTTGLLRAASTEAELKSPIFWGCNTSTRQGTIRRQRFASCRKWKSRPRR